MSAGAISTVRRRTAGVCFLMVPVLLAWLAVAVYDKDFSDDDTVHVQTDSVGNEMNLGADVKVRGVVVGRVSGIHADGQGATLTLKIPPSLLRQIPADVTAQMLPTTLFGERYVSLAPPTDTAGAQGSSTGVVQAAAQDGSLRPGAVIPQDRSGDAVELEQVFDHLLPLLDAVQPAQLSATLNAVATALQGRGKELGTTLTTLDAYLKQINPDLPQLNTDLHQLVTVSQTYADAAPDLLQALDELTTTTQTVAQQQNQLASLYSAATTSANTTTAFLRQNQGTIIQLSANSRGTLQLLSQYSSEFPCTFEALADFVPQMDKALGKGTGKPGLHIKLTTEPSRGKYVQGQDAPHYDATGGPKCYANPYAGHPNTPEENAVVNELMAPAVKAPARSLPDWSSLLAGPVLRGEGVGLQ